MITSNQRKLLDLVAQKTDLKWILHTDEFDGDKQAVVLEDSHTTCPYLVIEDEDILTQAEASKFFNAADNKPGHDKELRQAILEACRLV